MDPFAPASIPRRKRGGTTSFEQNHAPRDFRATLTEEQQMLYNPRIGTTRFAYEKQITLQGYVWKKFQKVWEIYVQYFVGHLYNNKVLIIIVRIIFIRSFSLYVVLYISHLSKL